MTKSTGEGFRILLYRTNLNINLRLLNAVTSLSFCSSITGIHAIDPRESVDITKKYLETLHISVSEPLFWCSEPHVDFLQAVPLFFNLFQTWEMPASFIWPFLISRALDRCTLGHDSLVFLTRFLFSSKSPLHTHTKKIIQPWKNLVTFWTLCVCDYTRDPPEINRLHSSSVFAAWSITVAQAQPHGQLWQIRSLSGAAYTGILR